MELIYLFIVGLVAAGIGFYYGYERGMGDGIAHERRRYCVNEADPRIEEFLRNNPECTDREVVRYSAVLVPNEPIGKPILRIVRNGKAA